MQPSGARAPKSIQQICHAVEGIVRDIKHLFGFESFLNTEDRRVLEQIIFPHFLNDQSFRSILFVGCDWYTRGYNKIFEAQKNYITLDPDLGKRKYGGKQHIPDKLQKLDRYFDSGSLDLILCNGVFGWGLNKRTDIDQAFRACFDLLRGNGVLVLGWNDIEELCPFPLHHSKSLALFKPLYFPPLKTDVYVTDTAYRHTYNFYVKPIFDSAIY
jgi:SAM-dependent methyltransferase